MNRPQLMFRSIRRLPRFFSTVVSRSKIPIKHSSARLPRVCTDEVERSELTDQLLQSGPLFTYQRDLNSSEDAWKTADSVVQMAEYVLRGHAWTIPYTQWNRWLMKTQPEVNFYPEETLSKMRAILDKLWDDGVTYMTLRDSRLRETQGYPVEQVDKGDIDMLEMEKMVANESEFDMMKDFSLDDGEEQEFDAMDALESGDIHAENEDLDVQNPKGYMEDFAMPGPTIDMYNMVLDAMACYPTKKSVEDASILFELILGRHKLDGGDAKNANPRTRLNVMSCNVAIRIAAESPYSSSDPFSEQARDQAIALAFGAFDVASNSTAVARNSATYAYLLKNVAKYFPSSRSRGNIAYGMLVHARRQGLVNSHVMEAYMQANVPSNGDEFDLWIEKHLKDKKVADLPDQWKRLNKTRRYHPREYYY